jgi:hypothetical protein
VSITQATENQSFVLFGEVLRIQAYGHAVEAVKTFRLFWLA